MRKELARMRVKQDDMLSMLQQLYFMAAQAQVLARKNCGGRRGSKTVFQEIKVVQRVVLELQCLGSSRIAQGIV